jgi:Domain of Unknown Function (DUF928)
MTQSTLFLWQTFLAAISSGVFVVGTGFSPVQAIPRQTAPSETSNNSLFLSLQFQPPGDVTPPNSIGGASRGEIKFAPPGDATPSNSVGGASRSNISFVPPGDAAPKNSIGGASRSDVRFAPPGDAAPRNSTGGGSRSGVSFIPPRDPAPTSTASGGIRTDEQPLLKALLPDTQLGRTVSAHPTFFVYVPPTASREVFFSLQDERRNHVYQTTLKISGNGGIVSVTLPKDTPELEVGKNYVWFFAPIAPGGTLEPDNYGVTGWVKRVEVPTAVRDAVATNPTQLASEYARAGIWYDTVAILANALAAQPNDATLASEWQDLLKQVGLEAIATQPLAE